MSRLWWETLMPCPKCKTGWLNITNHPIPCPVCGFKEGDPWPEHNWIQQQLPEIDKPFWLFKCFIKKHGRTFEEKHNFYFCPECGGKLA